MSLSSYTGLKTALAAWLKRDDLSAYYDDWIDLCEARMHRELRIRPMQKRAQYTTSDNTVELPCDFLEARAAYLSSDPKVALECVAEQTRNSMYGGSTTGKPVFFSIVGTEMLLGPSPDTSYTLELAYWAKFPALSSTQATNWVLTHAPDVYLFGALMEAAPFVHDEAATVYWAQRYAGAIETLQTSHADSGMTGMMMRRV